VSGRPLQPLGACPYLKTASTDLRAATALNRLHHMGPRGRISRGSCRKSKYIYQTVALLRWTHRDIGDDVGRSGGIGL